MDLFGYSRRQEAIRRWSEQLAVQGKLERAEWKPWAKPVLWLAIPLSVAGFMVVQIVGPDRQGRSHAYPPEYAWAGAAVCAVGLVLLVLVRRFGVRTSRVIDELKD
jgi:cell division protein FtsW (lipid II flippase)